MHQIAYSAAIAVPEGAALSDIVQFRICRDTDDDSNLFGSGEPYEKLNDPYTAAVHGMMFDVHFQINSLGSTDEYTK